MDQTEDETKRVSARERWSAHIEDWQTSGLTQIEYCRRAGIDPNSFSNWKRKIRESERREPAFVELPASRPAPLVEFSIGADGVSLRLNVNGDWAWRFGR